MFRSQYLGWGWQENHKFNSSLSYKASQVLPSLSLSCSISEKRGCIFFLKFTFCDYQLCRLAASLTINFLRFYLFYFKCMYVCMCTTSIQCPQRQKRALYPMGLELQPVVNDYCMLGTEPRSSERAASQLSQFQS